jgi:pantetheine-phosphate adenylyltransferase
MDTLFMMTSKDYYFISSRTIKEVTEFGGSVKGLVPEVVEKRLKERFNIS